MRAKYSVIAVTCIFLFVGLLYAKTGVPSIPLKCEDNPDRPLLLFMFHAFSWLATIAVVVAISCIIFAYRKGEPIVATGFATAVIAVVVLMIIANATVLAPYRSIPSRCTFPSGLTCESYEALNDGTVTYVLIANQLGDQIELLSATASSSSNSTFLCGFDKATVASGEKFSVSCAGTEAICGKFKMLMNLSYRESGSVNPIPSQGEILFTAGK